MKKWIGAAVCALCAALLAAGVPVSAAPPADTVPEASASAQDAAAAAAAAPGSYRAYAAAVSDRPAAREKLTVRASAFLSQSGTPAERLSGYKGTDDVLLIADGESSLRYTVDVPADGRYTLSLRYYPMRTTDRQPEIGLRVDGDHPFSGADRFRLDRVYQSESEIMTDAEGNEYAPRQVEAFDWYTQTLRLADGTADDPVEVFLSAGRHELTLCPVSGTYVLDTLTLSPPADIPSYAEYRQRHADGETGGQAYIKIEAESAARKSDPTLRPASDRTSPLTTPYHPSKVRMNILSSAWASPGQWLEWGFDAPADGWYALGFRYQQFTNINFFVVRRLSLDGEVPYTEAKRLRFAYGQDWTYATPADGSGQPLSVYLTAGHHTLRMEAVLGDYAALLDTLDDTVAGLNEMYRQILMITGTSPDKYQDYYLEREIPELTQTFTDAAKTLRDRYAYVRELTGTQGAQASLLGVFAAQLESFVAEPETVPLRLAEFKNNVGSLAAWVLDLKSQPLELDYIYLWQADAPQPAARPTFWQRVRHETRAFLASFFEDYNAMGTTGDGESIEVWVGSGRDQAQIIRMMISDLYTPTHGIGVRLKLVSAGMVEAFLSGRTPDVALSVGRGQPVNLAVRGALADLTQFSGFAETKDWFVPGALEPYYFESGCFGLPDTQSFYMLFARTDILAELGIDVPQTWAQLYAAIPKIQRFNMAVGIPYTTVDAFGAADAGLGVRNIFPALLMQNGGSFYTADKSGTALGTAAAVDAFVQWVALYRDYGLDLTYDFYNRFRTGETPLAIATYTEFARLEQAAPEIAGLWTMQPIPGTPRADGTIDRTQAGAGSACVILSSTKKPDAAWDFLRWYCSAEAQSRYAGDVEAQMGVLARVPLANVEALASLSWTKAQYAAIREQQSAVREVPEVLGGYYVLRGLDNAFREAVYEDKEAQEALRRYDRQINDEIRRKREEFGLG